MTVSPRAAAVAAVWLVCAVAVAGTWRLAGAPWWVYVLHLAAVTYLIAARVRHTSRARRRREARDG